MIAFSKELPLEKQALTSDFVSKVNVNFNELKR